MARIDAIVVSNLDEPLATLSIGKHLVRQTTSGTGITKD